MKDGENIITILVYNNVTGDNSTYQIIVNKGSSDLTEIEDALSDNTEKANLTRRIIFGITLFILVCIFIFVIVIYQKKQQAAYEEEEYEIENRMQNFNSAKEKLGEKPKKILDEYLDDDLNVHNETSNNSNENKKNNDEASNDSNKNLGDLGDNNKNLDDNNKKPEDSDESSSNNNGHLNNNSDKLNANNETLNNLNNIKGPEEGFDIEMPQDRKNKGTKGKGKHF